MNEQCNIKIRTPHGTSNPFLCERIVKQGAVLSTSLCGSSTSQLTKELESLADCGASILDAQVNAVLFVIIIIIITLSPIIHNIATK